MDLGDAVGKGGKDGASGHVGEGAAAPPTGTGVSAPPAPPRPHRPKALTDPAESVPAARPPSTTGPFGDVWHDIKRRILAKAGSPTDGRLPRSWAARGPVYVPSPRAHGSAFSNRKGSIHRLPRPRHRRTGRATSHAALRGREDGAQQRLTTHVFRCIVRLDHCLITAPQLACHSDGATSLGSSHGNGEDGASHGGFPIASCAPPMAPHRPRTPPVLLVKPAAAIVSAYAGPTPAAAPGVRSETVPNIRGPKGSRGSVGGSSGRRQ